MDNGSIYNLGYCEMHFNGCLPEAADVMLEWVYDNQLPKGGEIEVV